MKPSDADTCSSNQQGRDTQGSKNVSGMVLEMWRGHGVSEHFEPGLQTQTNASAARQHGMHQSHNAASDKSITLPQTPAVVVLVVCPAQRDCPPSPDLT
jgi:hypothetical protein